MIIIPTYNERRNIDPLLSRIRRVLPSEPILFVDYNSPDGTTEEIKNLQKLDSKIFLLHRSGKLGFASAYISGFEKILADHHPEYVVTMDGDLSHPPEKLPEMIGLAQSGK